MTFSIMITAAKLAIARAWVSPTPLSIGEWWTIIRELFCFESALAKTRGIRSMAKIEAIWGSLDMALSD